MKIVVFDLDETLGYFTEYGIFWDSLCIYVKNKNKLITKHFGTKGYYLLNDIN